MSAQLGNILYFLLLAGLFFFMMRFGCGAHIMGHSHHHGAKSSDDHASDGSLRWVPPDRAVDPVCGMTIKTNDAKSAVYNGQAYYFCSQDCRQKFEAKSASYAKPMAA
jgi:YHS domain-containing protein